MNITYSECVSVALGNQHAKCMRRIILSPTPYPALPYFSTLSHKRHDFQKILLNTRHVFWVPLQTFLEHFSLLRKIQRVIIKNVHSSSCKVPFLFVRFQWNINFLGRFSKNSQISNFMQFRPVGGELFLADRHTDRQADMMILVVAFRKFANASKIFKRPGPTLYMIMWPITDKISDNLAQNMPLCQRHDVASISIQHSNTATGSFFPLCLDRTHITCVGGVAARPDADVKGGLTGI